MNSELTNYIKKWNAYDEKISELNKTISKYRNEKQNIEDVIISYINKNNLEKTKINIGTHTLIKRTTYNLPSINKNIVEEALKTIFNNEKTIQGILLRIEKIREKNRKEITNIKKLKNKLKKNN